MIRPPAARPAARRARAGRAAPHLLLAGALLAGAAAALPAAAANPSAGEGISIRIGLGGDLERFALPCCDGVTSLSVGGETVEIRAPFTVEPAAGAVTAPEHRLQVAALRDERQAASLSRDLAARTGWPGDVRFDAASGLYQVRLGRFPARTEAEAARERLKVLGVPSAWVVQEGGALRAPALRVRTAERSFRVLGRWVAVVPGDGVDRETGGGALRVPAGSVPPDPETGLSAAGRYRGRLLLFLNDRGTLNLVNELPLEQYLRGVVPKELGPALYPRLEALKAQAVAARTYALRHRGEFAAEGYDLCALPRCQVYGGVGVEHPLSDRAVAETEGQVLLLGDEPVEALYSATCGGHTENAELVFPWMEAPHLRGVPCLEAGTRRLAGSLAAGTPFPEGLARTLVPPPPGTPPVARGALEVRLWTLVREAGLPLPDDRLASLSRREVLRFVRSVFDLILAPELLADPAAPIAPIAPTGDAAPRGAALPAPEPAVLRRAEERPERPLRPEEAEWLILSLAETAGLLERQEVGFLELEDGRLRASAAGGGRVELEVADAARSVATFRRSTAGTFAAPLDLAPGDRLEVYRWQGDLRALVHLVGPEVGGVPRRARLDRWTRFRSDRRLGELVAERFPGLGFTGLEVLERGVSGRVGAIRILGTGGRSVRVEGLAVRWTLDLPDTRFELQRVEEGGRTGWVFEGGGWGHGVGMCQTGAYGMAGRGLGYRDILGHYYTGVRLGRVVLRPPAQAPRP